MSIQTQFIAARELAEMLLIAGTTDSKYAADIAERKAQEAYRRLVQIRNRDADDAAAEARVDARLPMMEAAE